ncbi:hypothetical protein B0J14DRAFT_655126 [Halenospora varia]|nr:hypothetical protein B0J14DRAFT_655126 [Halenospora varia]
MAKQMDSPDKALTNVKSAIDAMEYAKGTKNLDDSTTNTKNRGRKSNKKTQKDTQSSAKSVSEFKNDIGMPATLETAKASLPKGPAEAFHPFPFLSPEPRVKVWDIVAHEPRLLELGSRFYPTFNVPRNDRLVQYNIHRISSRSRVPPQLLHISHQARVEE